MSTSLQKPKATERRKHVCRCKTYDCHLGVHLDANGVSQVGVELTPTAYESHQRAEKRRLARTKRNSNLSAAGRPHNSEDPNGTLTPLISQLNLNTRNPRGDSENQPDPLSRPHAWPTTPSPVDHTEPGIDSVNDPSVCAAALFAHQSGMESYDCGRLLLRCCLILFWGSDLNNISQRKILQIQLQGSKCFDSQRCTLNSYHECVCSLFYGNIIVAFGCSADYNQISLDSWTSTKIDSSTYPSFKRKGFGSHPTNSHYGLQMA